MPPSIACAVNFFNEVNALPGFIESAASFFNEIILVDCGPNGTPSTDGSLDIIRKWGLPVGQGSINDGFGTVRSKLIRSCKSDWVVIMDADERLHLSLPALECDGTEGYPQVEHPNLKVKMQTVTFNHKETLLQAIATADRVGAVAIQAIRRHWFDFSWTRPTQNWTRIPDLQCRIWRNVDGVGYRSDVKMHEQAWDFRTQAPPVAVPVDFWRGPFFDHYHCWFKAMEPEQRQHDLRIYNALHTGREVPSV